MLITKISPITRKENTLDIPITDAQFNEVLARQRPIQLIVPDLKPELREFLISGITPEEWKKEFGNIL